VIARVAVAGLIESNGWLTGLVQEVAAAVEVTLSMNRTRAHRREVYASVEDAVKRVLRRQCVKGETFRFLPRHLMAQVEAIYEQWPCIA